MFPNDKIYMFYVLLNGSTPKHSTLNSLSLFEPLEHSILLQKKFEKYLHDKGSVITHLTHPRAFISESFHMNQSHTNYTTFRRRINDNNFIR